MKKKVDIIIPVYYGNIDEIENSVKAQIEFYNKNLLCYKWKILIGINGLDKEDIIHKGKELSKKYKNVVCDYTEEIGRGASLNRLFVNTNADFVCYMDVDLSTDLKYFKPLIYSLSQGYDIAIGNRLMSQSIVKNRPFKREVLSRIYNIMIRLFFQVSISDAQCGFKAVTRDVASKLIPHIQDNAWFFDSELLIVGEKVGFNIYQQPVHWTDNPGSTVRVLKTVYGDLQGLWRLFWQRPWTKISI